MREIKERPHDDWEYPPLGMPDGTTLNAEKVDAVIRWYWDSGQAREDIAEEPGLIGMNEQRVIIVEEDRQTEGYKEMIRNPPEWHLPYLIKYVTVLEQENERLRAARSSGEQPERNE
jgi:hypothetical protein